ncbi:MAG: SDR family oxidoreductase [Planctomycetota bacterium]|nr:SDR family oxidoreductase [Planctomycetota bacterium]
MIEEYADHWALITGASSGIGAEFARRFAALGMHLVLTARREQPMRELAEQLHTQHGTKCEIVPCDLSESQGAAKLEQAVSAKGLTIELLVNNAGFGIVGEAQQTDREHVMRMLQVNMASLTDLTYRYLPGMMERGHGAVINVSSVAAFQPVAYMGAYAATKSYVLHFTEALWAEARDHGVTVLAVCPGTTRTDFFESAGVGGWLKKRRSQSSEQVVKNTLKALEKKRQYVVSGWKNYILSLLVRLASRKTAVMESRKYFRPSPKKKDE